MVELEIDKFQEIKPSIESYWRSIILFGKNTTSYKFALAECLLEFAKKGKNEISIEELSILFSQYICNHIKDNPKQGTNKTNPYFDACMKFNNKEILEDELIYITKEKAFRWVLDCFHNVNNRNIPIEFFIKDFKGSNKKIVLTDNVFKLNECINNENFLPEIEARWKLVETAWELGVSTNLLNVSYNEDNNPMLFVDDNLRRKNITSARDALNGYQKGKCFYCFCDISINPESLSCEVDHFFPYALQKYMPNINLNGAWNLVLACKECNGSGGKGAKIPREYLERLSRRNEYLISSHHPLRENIIQQTGKSKEERSIFLNNVCKRAIELLIHTWTTEKKGDDVF